MYVYQPIWYYQPTNQNFATSAPSWHHVDLRNHERAPIAIQSQRRCVILYFAPIQRWWRYRERERAAREWECVLTWMHAYKHLVMIPDDGKLSKRKSNDHIAPPTRPAAGRPQYRSRRTGPPSHRTSTKPSGGRGVTGAKTPRARQRQEQRKKTMLWRMWVSPMKRKSIYLSICLSVCRSVYLSIYRSIDLSIYRSIYLSI